MKRALSIGRFDGVHRGHRELLQELVGASAAAGLAPAALILDGVPDKTERLLPVWLQEKYIRESGVATVLRVELDVALRRQTPRQFVELLGARWGAGLVVVGENFHFGADRSGDAEELRRQGRAAAITVRVQPLTEYRGAPVSSTRVRSAIRAGDLGLATELLTTPPVVSGLVARGAGRGRELGFPTANLVLRTAVMPPYGVYLARVTTADSAGWGLVSWGERPTFSDARGALCEVHVLDWQGDLYGQELTLWFIRQLRAEIAFSDKEGLIRQMRQDKAQAEEHIAAYAVERKLRRSTG